MSKVYLVDNFLPNAAEVREQALNSEFGDYTGYDEQVYKRVCITEIPGLQDQIEKAFGPVEMLGMGFRLNYEDELPNQAIHSDMGWGTHALVLYLCEGNGGTAFWEHKSTGASVIEPGQIDLWESIDGDWDDVSKWKQLFLAELKFNRAVIYESKRFHSRYPFKAFGSTPEDGRLIAVAFFTPKKLKVRAGKTEDIPTLVELYEEFYLTTGYAFNYAYDPETVSILTQALIDDGVLLVAERLGKIVGSVGSYVGPFLFNKNHKASTEVVWWVHPDERKTGVGDALLTALEKQAKAKGALVNTMVRLNSSPSYVDDYYESKGYKFAEKTFTKRL